MADLYLSPKFAEHLAHQGMLQPIVNALKQYREKQNFPFVLAQKRIIKQAVFKALCDLYSGSAKKPKADTILKTAESVADRIYGKDPSSASEEIMKQLKVEKEKTAEEKPSKKEKEGGEIDVKDLQLDDEEM